MILTMLESAVIKGLDELSAVARGKRSKPPSHIVLGRAARPYHQDRWEEVTLDAVSRLGHIYIAGGTGVGKTKLIEMLIQQDILAGNGIALADPHGDLTTNILRFLAKHFGSHDIDALGKRLILVEPFNREWAVGFNPLRGGDRTFPATLELLEIFRRFWGNGYWGPRMDEVLRNTLITLSENNLTLLEARPLLTHPDFRQNLVQGISFGEVRDYWTYRYNPLSDKMQAMYREPVLNKITAFITDPSIYRILGQRDSTVDFRQAMDEGKWVLLNLSKGHLKENLRLLGTIFLAKIKQASLSRIDTPEDDRRPFFVFVDEFQNFVEEDIETILSEARKFRLGLTLVHQNLDQLPAQLRSAILGNAGTEIFFRLSHHDAAQISSELDQKDKHLIEKRLIDFRVGEAYLKIKGHRARLFKTLHVPSIPDLEDIVGTIKRASFQHWSNPVAEVEESINERRGLWANDMTIAGHRKKEPHVSPVQAYETLRPDDSFEEGQSEW